MTLLIADLDWTQSLLVEVDVEKLCATYAEERASFDGTDEDFVKDTLSEIAYDLLHPEQSPNIDDGIIVRQQFDDLDISLRQKRAERTA